MPISRRYELLGWAARKPDRYIIEDDYDSELRLSGKPVPTLQSIDVSGHIIYINLFPFIPARFQILNNMLWLNSWRMEVLKNT